MTLKALAAIAGGILLLGAVGVAVWYGSPTQAPEDEAMRQLAADYLEALYAQDYERAYSYVSARDQRTKAKSVYLRENPSFPEPARTLATELAAWMEIGKPAVSRAGDRATIEFPVRIPDANSPELQELFKEFDPDRLAQLSPEQQQQIVDSVRRMQQDGSLPMVSGTQNMDLINEDGKWRVFVNWTDTVKVIFRAEVKEGLPWAFEPVQSMVLAKPGETLHAAYRAKNLSDVTLDAKARHMDAPEELAGKYLDVIQCFCFIRQRLAPGEEKELPVVFRVDLDVPRDVREFVVTYQFYPLDKFPKDEDDARG